MIVDLPSVGAKITTLIGLLGFAVACAALAYIQRMREKRKLIRTLPADQRAQAIDKMLTRYGLSLSDMQDDEMKFLLVTREMDTRSSTSRYYVALGLAAFVLCFAMLLFFGRKGASPPLPQPVQRTVPDPQRVAEAESAVIAYKKEILDLRGDVEHNFNVGIPGWQTAVREKSIRLANLIGTVDESQLRSAKKILQHEYRGWAFLIAADTFGTTPQKNEQQVDFATNAIAEFDLALARMAEIVRDYRAGKPEATQLYEWITGTSEDLNRTHYLKAAALAVVALAGGDRTKADATHELSLINPAYLTSQPASNHPALAWALQN
jgi:hypothetical protein